MPIFQHRLVHHNDDLFHYIAFENGQFYFADFSTGNEQIMKIDIETLDEQVMDRKFINHSLNS